MKRKNYCVKQQKTTVDILDNLLKTALVRDLYDVEKYLNDKGMGEVSGVCRRAAILIEEMRAEIQDAHSLAFNLLPNREIDDMTDTLCEQIKSLQTAFDNHTQELRIKELSQWQIPKCWQLDEDNNLIQNKVITIGMHVYFLLPDKSSYTILEDTIYSINIDKDGMHIYLEKYTYKKTQELYSTKEAARAAMEK